MSWIVIALVFVALWAVESMFGWLFGAQLRDWLMLVALIYFGVTINKLKSAQAELQTELNRLWKVVKTAHTVSAISPKPKPEPATKITEPVDDVLAWTQPDEAASESIWRDPDAKSATSWTAPQAHFQTQASHVDAALQSKAPAPESEQDAWYKPTYSPQDHTPNFLENWLAGGNWIVRAGLAILFIGLVFLAKFAYDNALLPLELRLAAIAAAALALLVAGWRSRIARPAYGLALQGGGVGVLYLTIFATAKLTVLLPSMLAMALMLLVAVLAASLAILQDAIVLAVIGTTSGFMAPVLMSTGQGSHIALFSYFAALNTGILTVALHKAWRPLNVLAFFFTYGIAGLWGLEHYQSEYRESCLLFLGLFFGMFVAIGMLFTRHQNAADEYSRAIDATLLFGVPTATFGYGLYLLKPYEYGGAWLAVLLSAIYLLLGYFARGQARLAQLTMPWAALSLLSATLAVPLAFDARLTSTIWALEGAAVVSYAWRQRQAKTRYFGYLLVLLGTAGFILHWPYAPDSIPLLNTLSIGLLVMALAYGVIGWSVNRLDQIGEAGSRVEISDESNVVSWIMALALALTGALIIITEIFTRNSAAFSSIAVPLLLWGWALGLHRVGHFAHWPQTIAPVVVLPLLTLLLPICHSWVRDNLTTQGLVLTALALLTLLCWQAIVLKIILPELKRWFSDLALPPAISALPGFALVVFWVTLLIRGRNTWSSSIIPEAGITLHGWFLPLATALPVALLWWLTQAQHGRNDAAKIPRIWRWLHGDDDLPDAAVNKQLSVFALVVSAFIIATTLFHSGQGGYGLDYFPLVNLYELVATGGLLALFSLFRHTAIWTAGLGENRNRFLNTLVFLFANSILSRILANFFGAEFALGFAWHSAIAATSYSIIWSLAALIMMWLASKRLQRGLWITGAVLLAVVALKLLLIDLSKVGSLARIISFIGVGVLMLVVGYIAPIPADGKTAQQ